MLLPLPNIVTSYTIVPTTMAIIMTNATALMVCEYRPRVPFNAKNLAPSSIAAAGLETSTSGTFGDHDTDGLPKSSSLTVLALEMPHPFSKADIPPTGSIISDALLFRVMLVDRLSSKDDEADSNGEKYGKDMTPFSNSHADLSIFGSRSDFPEDIMDAA
jgi:hypothetical protein